ncbi:MAG: hypothetical protein RQ754_04370 [Desulfuromonadales bacterium]|nr:hypothetical protein [Desulfuromonadales bacterium]
MKNTVRNTLIAMAIFSTSAFAAGSNVSGEGGLLVSLFVGFFALIIVFQLVPAALMLIGLFKGLFGHDESKVAEH